jgi:uncharacterized protein (TIGR02145 family)
MNTTIKTGLAVLLLAISCKKENINRPSALTTNDASDMVAGKYSHVRIGTQVWMTKNLDVTRYRNGDRIPQVKDPTKWAALTTGGWCWYNNDSTTGAIYGRLYNWYAVNDPRGLAPKGWHIPSTAEWDTLSTYLGSHAGGKSKDTGTIEAGTGLWHAPNAGATNKSGFTGLPGGIRNFINGEFYDIGSLGYWWSSTQNDVTSAWERSMSYAGHRIDRFFYDENYGLSVRCIRD